MFVAGIRASAVLTNGPSPAKQVAPRAIMFAMGPSIAQRRFDPTVNGQPARVLIAGGSRSGGVRPMTVRKRLKRLVRARAGITGESHTSSGNAAPCDNAACSPKDPRHGTGSVADG